MVIDFLIACSTFFIGWSFPPFFLPLGFSLVGILLLKGIDPWTMCIGMTLAGTLSYIPLWIVEWYILDALWNYQPLKKNSSYLGRVLEFLVDVLANKKHILNSRKSLKEYIGTKNSKITLFAFAIFLTAPTIPDILTVSLFRRRMSLWWFLFAGFLGKAITFVPFVFFWKGILDLIFW